MHNRKSVVPMLLILTLFLVVGCEGAALLPDPDVTRRGGALGVSQSSAATPSAPRSSAFPIISDDFNACELNTDLWTFIDPYVGTVGESTLQVRGYSLDITIPSGIDHGVGEMPGEPFNRMPRVLQSVDDVDFGLDVKFRSGVSETVQLQGILAEEDAANFLTIGVQADDGGPRLIASQYVDGVELTPSAIDQALSSGEGPLYLRVARNDDRWTVEYAYDGQHWNDGGVFTHTLSVGAVGLYGGNAGLQPPIHTLSVDYFFNASSPIMPQDGVVMYVDDLQIEIDPIAAAGVVSGGPVSPTPGNPGCGNPIRLTASPGAAWLFDAWLHNGEETSVPTLTGEFAFGEVILAQFRPKLPPSPTPTVTSTGTPDEKPSQTPTATSTSTSTGTLLPVTTVTGTPTDVSTLVPERTLTPTTTSVPTGTKTATATQTATATATNTPTGSVNIYLPLIFN